MGMRNYKETVRMVRQARDTIPYTEEQLEELERTERMLDIKDMLDKLLKEYK